MFFLNRVTDTCIHYHGQYVHHLEKKPMPISSHSSFTLPPAPGNHESTFCLCRFPYSGHIKWMASYNMWSFVTGFFHLALTKYTFWSFIFEGRWVGLDPGSTASWLCGIRQMAWPLWASVSPSYYGERSSINTHKRLWAVPDIQALVKGSF